MIPFPYEYETAELKSYLDAFFDSLAGRVFDWDSKPLRWRLAMRFLAREWHAGAQRTQNRMEYRLGRMF